MDKNDERLIREALEAREGAYAPYSGFKVGAAFLSASGKVYRGCNIENAAYPVTICAERTAVVKAVSEGEREFRKIAIVGSPGDRKGCEPCPPCGMCRQMLREFCGSGFTVLLPTVSEDGRITAVRELTLHELLPESFGPENLRD